MSTTPNSIDDGGAPPLARLARYLGTQQGRLMDNQFASEILRIATSEAIRLGEAIARSHPTFFQHGEQ